MNKLTPPKIPPARPQASSNNSSRAQGGFASSGFGSPSSKTSSAGKSAMGGFQSQSQSATSVPTFKLPDTFTDEQQAIINSQDRLVFGQALAGTGKSTTAIAYVKARPHAKILVLCYNTANAAEAREKYPQVCKNATVKTVHGLAYDFMDDRLKHRVTNRWNPLMVRNDLAQIGLRSDIRTAAITHSLLVDFFHSTDNDLLLTRHSSTAIDTRHATPRELQKAHGYAKRLWAAMQAVDALPGMLSEINSVSIPHDAYLKMFSLEKRRLPFDALILDEAQDANAIMLQIMVKQYEQGAGLVFLGDTHQSIYDFRGAVNAMDPKKMPAKPAIYPLTQSWRMGPRTASIANLILKDLKGESLRIQAKGQDAPFDESAPYALLSRLNATLVEEAAKRKGRGIYWIGGAENYPVSRLLDAWYLSLGRVDDMQDPFMRHSFSSYLDFEEAAEYDSELNVIKNLVNEYKHEIPSLVENIFKNEVKEESQAQVIFSTAHKSKGLEWDYVRVANDFKDVYKKAESWLKGEDEQFPEQEVNLLYVCFTRAKKAVKLNEQTYNWVLSLNEHRPQRIRSFGRAARANSIALERTDSVSKQQSTQGKSPFTHLPSFSPSP